VRQINLDAIDKWSEAIGAENIITCIGPVIEKDNPEIRTVLLEWMLKNKEFISKSEVDKLPKALVSCIQDKAPAIRAKTEEVIIEIIPLTGPAAFRKIVSDLKPAIQNTVKPLIDKCLSKSNFGEPEPQDEPVIDEPKEIPSAIKAKPIKDPKNSSIKGKRPNTAAPMTAK